MAVLWLLLEFVQRWQHKYRYLRDAACLPLLLLPRLSPPFSSPGGLFGFVFLAASPAQPTLPLSFSPLDTTLYLVASRIPRH